MSEHNSESDQSRKFSMILVELDILKEKITSQDIDLNIYLYALINHTARITPSFDFEYFGQEEGFDDFIVNTEKEDEIINSPSYNRIKEITDKITLHIEYEDAKNWIQLAKEFYEIYSDYVSLVKTLYEGADFEESFEATYVLLHPDIVLEYHAVSGDKAQLEKCIKYKDDIDFIEHLSWHGTERRKYRIEELYNIMETTRKILSFLDKHKQVEQRKIYKQLGINGRKSRGMIYKAENLGLLKRGYVDGKEFLFSI